MELKLKKCKCGTKFKQYNSLQSICVACAILKAKAKAKVKTNFKKQLTKHEYNKTNYAHQLKLTKSVIQKWVNNTRDKNKPCISCETTNNIVYAGGHFFTAGGHPETALNSLGIFRQCNFHCNSNKSGNIEGDKNSRGMKNGIIELYGQERIDYLKSPRSNAKYTASELMEIRVYYNKLIRDNINDDCRRVY